MIGPSFRAFASASIHRLKAWQYAASAVPSSVVSIPVGASSLQTRSHSLLAT